MSVFIKGMEIPECCGYCPFEYKNYCMAKPSLRVESADRHPRCPLFPAADVRPVPKGGIGEMSDGYHTFNGLYYQRMVLFAALVKAHKDKAWKSWRHEDGERCFGGGWFIVGIDTPEGSYTYHYEDKDWDRFECEELPVAKHWDGHTEKDVTRLLSLDVRPVVKAHWYWDKDGMDWNIGAWRCSACEAMSPMWWNADRGSPMHKSGHRFCPNCGADMMAEPPKEE